MYIDKVKSIIISFLDYFGKNRNLLFAKKRYDYIIERNLKELIVDSIVFAFIVSIILVLCTALFDNKLEIYKSILLAGKL